MYEPEADYTKQPLLAPAPTPGGGGARRRPASAPRGLHEPRAAPLPGAPRGDGRRPGAGADRAGPVPGLRRDADRQRRSRRVLHARGGGHLVRRDGTGSFLLALLAAPAVVGVVAVLADRLVLRRIGYEPESTIVATIGLLYILQQLVLTTYGPYARPVAPPVYFRVDFPGFGYSGYKLVVAVAAAAAARGDVDRAVADASRALHAGHAAGPGDRPGVRGAGEPRLHARLRRRGRAGGRGRGARSSRSSRPTTSWGWTRSSCPSWW